MRLEFQLRKQIQQLKLEKRKENEEIVHRNKTMIKDTSSRNILNTFRHDLDVKKTNIQNDMNKLNVNFKGTGRQVRRLTGLNMQQRK